eukprot:3987277-Pyramimonas_sp.AAC.1
MSTSRHMKAVFVSLKPPLTMDAFTPNRISPVPRRSHELGAVHSLVARWHNACERWDGQGRAVVGSKDWGGHWGAYERAQTMDHYPGSPLPSPLLTLLLTLPPAPFSPLSFPSTPLPSSP